MTKWTEEQKEAIYKSGTNIIVSAGAGSGKTAVLTERVLEKVKNGISLNNLLILTFTKMAAKEMRERIESKLIKEGLFKEAEKVDTANITTFDAYALSLVKKYHYYLNVSKDIGIIESSVIELYKKEMLNNIFEELYDSENIDFLSLVKEYSIKDDHELFDYILLVSDKLDLKVDKEKYLNSYLEEYFNQEKIDNDIKFYTKEIVKLIDKIRDYLGYIEDSQYLSKLEGVLDKLLLSSSYDEIKENIDIKLPIARGLSDNDKEYKERISNTIKEIKKLTTYSSSTEIKKSILKTKNYVKTIINIIKILDDRVSTYKRKYDYYEYCDIARMAIKLVKENIEVRDEIKNNLNEILIDEYQDTNDIQEKFISYISSNNVYMVGDIKQSIYKFRNANPYIFKSKYDSYDRNMGGIKIDLNKNFRSREEVIEGINFIFSKIMDDDIGGASYASSHQMIFGNLTYKEEDNGQDNRFEVYSYLNDTNFKREEIEAFIIAKDINEKIKNNYKVLDKDSNRNRNIKYSDFAILIDNSKSFELFKKILEYEGIPTSIVKAVNLIDGEIIILIKNIISFILKIKEEKFDTEFKRLFMSLGRSFLFSINDDELFGYFLNNNFTDSEIYVKAKLIANDIDNIMLDDILDIIVKEYNFYEKLILVGDYKENVLRIEKLKEITNNLVSLNYSIYEYNDYLDMIIKNKLKIEYQVNDINSDTVKIMTIHASKGLEFNVCYFSLLYSKFNIREVINKFSYDEKYGLIIPYKDEFINNTIYHNLSYKSYVKENIGERIRLFYVALTRAREKMIFILPKGKENRDNVIDEGSLKELINKYSSFASILYSLEPFIKGRCKNIGLDSLNLTKNYNLIRNDNYQNSLNIIKDKIEVEEICINETIKEDKSFSKNMKSIISSSDKCKLDYGKRIHEILENIDFYNPNYDILSVSEKTIVSNFINNIDIKDANIYKEYEFIYEEDNTIYHGIIDLMLEYQDKIKIIDYKLKNINDTAYLRQLDGYKNYIERVFDKRVEIYLYSIMDNVLQKL
ncbi:MAG: UvrD-helicase domain-containing protein [Bacilli bacterium]